MSIEAVTSQLKTAAGRIVDGLGQRTGSAERPSRLRSFDPIRIADLEYRAWVGYYLRKWPQVLLASIGLVRVGFGLNWYRTLHGAWLVLRANQHWAPVQDNRPDRARHCMQRFYALLRQSYGHPADPKLAAELEIEWWRVHREVQYSTLPRQPGDELVESVTRLYSYLYSEPEAEVRRAAQYRARAMDLSDQWVEEGCQPDSPLLVHEHAALVRGYAALLAAVHH